MKTSTFSIPLLLCLLLFGGLGNAFAQILDISSGGAPTITGALGGSVTGSASVKNNLAVTINFGEISAANTNNIIKVTVPIAIRSTIPYQINVSLLGTPNLNPQAIQATDVGFGANNLRSLGAQAQICTNSSHIIYPPFSNDPSANVTIAANGRASYPSTLNDVVISTVIMSGPRLTRNSNGTRQSNDGYTFDAIFAITPQFFAPGTSTAVITFTISAGPNVPC